MLTQRTVHVHSNMVTPQAHSISIVPRSLGEETHPTGFHASTVVLLMLLLEE